MQRWTSLSCKDTARQGANPDTSDRWMWTPLYHAARGSHSKLVALLFANGADPNAQTPLGLTAGHIAASRGDTATIRLILEARSNMFDGTLTTREGNTLLHSAAEAGHLEVLRLLLLKGLDPLAKNKYGLTAQDLVPNNQSAEVRGVFSAHTEASLLRNGIRSNELDFTPLLENVLDETRSSPSFAISHLYSDTPVIAPYCNIHDLDFAIPEISWGPAPSYSDDGIAIKSPGWTHNPRITLVEPSPPSSPAGSLENDMTISDVLQNHSSRHNARQIEEKAVKTKERGLARGDRHHANRPRSKCLCGEARRNTEMNKFTVEDKPFEKDSSAWRVERSTETISKKENLSCSIPPPLPQKPPWKSHALSTAFDASTLRHRSWPRN